MRALARTAQPLGPRQEELLSYLTGLAPVGETIETPIRHVMEDLSFGCRFTFYQRLNALIRNGCVRRIACGARQTTGVLVVLRRLEEMGDCLQAARPSGVVARPSAASAAGATSEGQRP